MRTVGEILSSLLDSLNNNKISVVETGCRYTSQIAYWMKFHPESNFVCVDLNFGLLLETHKKLEQDKTAAFCTLLAQEHAKWLGKTTWLDAAFLDPEDLKSGQEEFQLAASAGARIVVMSDYQTRAYSAIKRAKEIGWAYEYSGDLNILRRL